MSDVYIEYKHLQSNFVTDWFEIDSTFPEQEGVYNVSCRSTNQTGDWYSYFDGVKFGYFAMSPQQAYYRRHNYTKAVAVSWRGLTKEGVEYVSNLLKQGEQNAISN